MTNCRRPGRFFDGAVMLPIPSYCAILYPYTANAGMPTGYRGTFRPARIVGNTRCRHDEKKYDVFLSHRRKEGWTHARLLYYALKDYDLKAYLDVENPKAGRIDVILSEVIENCDHFVIVLTPGALDGCWDEEDWVRLEVEKARNSHKNIIPVLMDGFSFPKEMPESMRFLKKQGGLTVTGDYYADFVKKLVDMLKTESPTQNMNENSHTQTTGLLPTSKKTDGTNISSNVIRALQNAAERTVEEMRLIQENETAASKIKVRQTKEISDRGTALATYEEAEKLYRAEGNYHGLANVLMSRGDLLSRTGRFDEALAAYGEAERFYQAMGDNLGLANVLQARGDILQANGH